MVKIAHIHGVFMARIYTCMQAIRDHPYITNNCFLPFVSVTHLYLYLYKGTDTAGFPLPRDAWSVLMVLKVMDQSEDG